MARKTVSDYIAILARELESLDRLKDQWLFFYIKKYWPRSITPNQLTWTRIVIGLALFILLFNFRNNNGLVIFPLFVIGALTDLLDGAIARCLDQKTRIGEIIDPVADRILLIPIFIYTIIDFRLLLFFIVFFEILNATISLFAQGKEVVFGSNIFGKTKMFLQSVVLVAILLFWPQIPNLFFIALLWVSVICSATSVILKIFDVRSYYTSKYAKEAAPL